MEKSLNFKLPVDFTTILIQENCIVNYESLMSLLSKLKIDQADYSEIIEDDKCIIPLSKNTEIPKRNWKILIKYLLKNKIDFSLEIKVI